MQRKHLYTLLKNKNKEKILKACRNKNHFQINKKNDSSFMNRNAIREQWNYIFKFLNQDNF